jgi:hypothetical protein
VRQWCWLLRVSARLYSCSFLSRTPAAHVLRIPRRAVAHLSTFHLMHIYILIHIHSTTCIIQYVLISLDYERHDATSLLLHE